MIGVTISALHASKLILHKSRDSNAAVYQFARCKRVKDSLERSGIQCHRQTLSEVWGSGATETEFPRSVFRGEPPMREERWCGQMSKAISVRPDKLQLGYHLLL